MSDSKTLLPKLLIALFWLITTVILIDRHYGLREAPSFFSAASEEKTFEETWMGIYRGMEKIGYSATKTERLDKGYRVSESIHMTIKMMEKKKKMEMSTVCALTEDYKLDSFVFEIKSDVQMKIQGRMSGKFLFLSLESGGVRSEEKMAFREAPYLSQSLGLILTSGVKEGQRMRLPLFDPSTLSSEGMEIEVLSKETIKIAGSEKDAFKIRGYFRGMEFLTWVGEKGETLKEENMGLTFISEPEEKAVKLDSPSIDLVTDFSIPFDMKLSGDVDYLKVRISGISLDGLDIDGGNQILKGDILEVRKIDSGANPHKLSRAEIDEYLSESLFIRPGDPKIASTAKKIVKNEKNAFKKARLIYDWVYENIEKIPSLTIPESTEVLKSRRGDCNEHTVLYAALARAVGVPTRTALGVVYRDGYFYYHAWPEIFVDGWFSIDPTLGQWPSDATHIRLISGELGRQTRIAGLIGKLKIEGLEYK